MTSATPPSARAYDVPGHANLRGVVVGTILWFVTGIDPWLLLAVLLFEGAFFGWLARKPHLRPFCGRVLLVGAATWLLLLMFFGGVFLMFSTPVPA